MNAFRVSSTLLRFMDPIMIKRQTKTKHTEATAKGWRNRRPDPGDSGESVVFLFSFMVNFYIALHQMDYY
jgi:hypothetical protein